MQELRHELADAHSLVLRIRMLTPSREVPQVLFRLSRWENLEHAEEV